MHNELRETWVYQEILHEGRQEGREIERQAALDQERLNLTTFVRQRYPEIVDLAKNKANSISNLETLQEIFLRVSLANTQEEVVTILS